jgi:hypothetical protein
MKNFLELRCFGQKEEESPHILLIRTFCLLASMFLVIFVKIGRGLMEKLISFFLTSFWKGKFEMWLEIK